MDLKPILKITIADDGKSFAFADNTLEDNQSVSTNYWNGTLVTRYNTNISLATSDPTYYPDMINSVDLVITDPVLDEYTFTGIDVPVTSREITILNTEIGQTDVIPDGVYTFDYTLWNTFNTVDNLTGAIGDTIITVTELPPSLEVGLLIRFNTDPTWYTILALTETTITLDKELVETLNTRVLYVGYTYKHYEVFDFKTNCCIDKSIAAAATKTDCGNCVSDALKAAASNYILLLGAKAQARNGMASEAQATIDLLGKLCAGDEFNCNC